MIRLTSALTHYPLWVNPDHITDIGTGECSGDERTYVSLVTDTDRNHPPYYVSESPQEVARKVLEWRLAMIDYHHDIPSVKTKAMAELVRLAGLEEPNHE